MTRKIKIVFLCYHYLRRNDEFKRIWGHDFDQFKKHIEFLEKEYKPISIDDLSLFLEGKDIELPEKCSILTFDDGLKEQATRIAPYLAKKKISAIFNVCPCVIDGEPATPQVIHCGTAYYGVKNFYKLVKRYLDMDLFSKKYTPGMNALELNSEIKNFFKMEVSYDIGRKTLLEIWHKELERDIPDIMSKIFMNEKDIKSISSLNHSLGLHTNTHPPHEYSNFFFEEEIEKPKLILEKISGKEVSVFTYPYGYEDRFLYNKNTLGKMRGIGLKYIFAIYKKYNKLHKNFIGRYSSQSGDSVDVLKNNIWEYEVTRHC